MVRGRPDRRMDRRGGAGPAGLRAGDLPGGAGAGAGVWRRGRLGDLKATAGRPGLGRRRMLDFEGSTRCWTPDLLAEGGATSADARGLTGRTWQRRARVPTRRRKGVCREGVSGGRRTAAPRAGGAVGRGAWRRTAAERRAGGRRRSIGVRWPGAGGAPGADRRRDDATLFRSASTRSSRFAHDASTRSTMRETRRDLVAGQSGCRILRRGTWAFAGVKR